MTPLWQLLLLTLGVAVALTTVAWLLSLARDNVTVVDIFWGLLFVGMAWAASVASDSPAPRRWLVPILVTVWGLRLSLYLLWRSWGKPEDYRYRQMRDHHGSAFRFKSLVIVFWLQAAIAWVVALPLVQATRSPIPAGWSGLDLVGVVLFLVGLFFETVGDLQLARFKADPSSQGKVMDGGLWRYTRHPNYFGDAVAWWGLFCFAVATPAGWWTVIGPLVMTGLLMKVSGVALLEKKLEETKPRYRDYVRRTNAFFPWFPKP